MEPALFFDTETSGLPDWHNPSGGEHIVQLGAVLLDLHTRKTLAALDMIIRPNGWVVPEETTKVHGITTDYALRYGVPEDLAVELLLELNARATLRVAHNQSFDERIVRIACKRYFAEESAEEWRATPTMCTAVLATPIMDLPPTPKMVRAGFNKPKTPKLIEAVRFFCGRELQDAHSAMADVFFQIRDRAVEAAPA